LFVFYSLVLAQTDIYDSGGPLLPEQAAYDVTHYNLDLFINPADSTIKGSVTITAKIVQPLDHFVVDLDTLLIVDNVYELDDADKSYNKSYYRQSGKVRIVLNTTRQPGENIKLKIDYGGKPLIALRPPWTGGFQWTKTKDGLPWIATSCQGEGADIWFPNKDHVSDEPDSMNINIRVPDPLFCASNGRLLSQENHDDNTTTYHWFVSNPINNYNVALNIGPYKLIDTIYTSIAGDQFPVMFWVLPEDYEKGVNFFPEILEHLKFFEKLLGPYPFRADKYGVVQTPHLGMEHQTIIAYGAKFNNSAMTGRDWGFDALHHHELSHEWWGNLVTNSDWRDLWLHEGFGTYMQALYVEELQGIEKYHEFMSANKNFRNEFVVAPRESKSENEIVNSPVYTKGAWFLHTLRYVIGDEAFKLALRRMVYPTPGMELVTDGSQTRFASTDDFLTISERTSGKKLDWLFEMYLRQPFLPKLDLKIVDNSLSLKWITPNDMSFPMPVDIKLGSNTRKIVIPAEGLLIEKEPGIIAVIDPDKWILFEPAAFDSAIKYIEMKNYRKAREAINLVFLTNRKITSAENMLKHIDFIENRPLNNELLKIYEGKYQMFGNYPVSIIQDDDALYYTGGMKGMTKLYPISSTQFATSDSDRILKFILDGEGNVSGFTVGRMRAKKIE
jgi:aminopeptidase N